MFLAALAMVVAAQASSAAAPRVCVENATSASIGLYIQIPTEGADVINPPIEWPIVAPGGTLCLGTHTSSAERYLRLTVGPPVEFEHNLPPNAHPYMPGFDDAQVCIEVKRDTSLAVRVTSDGSRFTCTKIT